MRGGETLTSAKPHVAADRDTGFADMNGATPQQTTLHLTTPSADTVIREKIAGLVARLEDLGDSPARVVELTVEVARLRRLLFVRGRKGES